MPYDWDYDDYSDLDPRDRERISNYGSNLNYAAYNPGDEMSPPDDFEDFKREVIREAKERKRRKAAEEKRWQAAEEKRKAREKELEDLLYGSSYDNEYDYGDDDEDDFDDDDDEFDEDEDDDYDEEPYTPSPPQRRIKTKVAGIGFDNRADIWEPIEDIYGTDNPEDEGLLEAIELVRDPDNVYDSNAIAVYVACDHGGYIPKSEARILAPLMDAGRDVQVVSCKARKIEKSSGDVLHVVNLTIDVAPE